MALLFVDGFDHWALADFTKKWSSRSGNFEAMSGSGGRRGTGCFQITHRFGYARKGFASNIDQIVLGVAVNINSLVDTKVITLGEGTTTHLSVNITSNNALEVYRGGTLLGTTANNVFSYSSYFYLEIKAKIHDSDGLVQLRINNVSVLSLSSIDTRNAGNAYINFLTIFSPNDTTSYDDLYVCDTTGTTNNDFLGDCRVDTLFPTAEGNYSDFTPSAGSDNALNVDEATPNTTDYNSSTTMGHRDSFVMENLAPLVSQAVYGVQVSAAVYKDDSGARGMAPFVRSGAVDSADGATLGLGTNMMYASHIFEQNPAGAIPWTEAAVNAAEAGVKVTL